MVDPEWQRTFRNRMQGFGRRRPPTPGEIAISVKVRVSSGCFHREHSPHAYEMIDAYLSSSTADLEFEEHESGPELLVYLAAATAGLTFAKSVIDLITAIINARSEGIKRGDHPNDPIELIVRRSDDRSGFREETVLQIGHNETADSAFIEKQLAAALKKLLTAPKAGQDKPLPPPNAAKRKK